MAHIAVMPKLGLTMTEGIVSKWRKAEGESVKEGDVLFEVTTDKLTNEVQAVSEGILRKQLVAEGAVVPCTGPVAIIAGADEDLDSVLFGIDTVKMESDGYKASPAAKKLAESKNIDLNRIVGTGPQGRIVLKDVEVYMESSRVKSSPAAAKLANDLGICISDIEKNGRIMKEDVLKAGHDKQIGINEVRKDRRIPLSSLRKVIAGRMAESWSISPMVSYNAAVDITRMKALKDSLANECNLAGVKLTYNHIIIKICAKALQEMPYINGSLEGDELVLHAHVNIGLAVSVENGLLVPNVKNVELKSLLGIAEETEKLVDSARSNRLMPDDLSFGTFTVTNIGMYGIESFTPIINQPELAILGIAEIVEKPVVIDGEIAVRPIMNLSLTADHRVIDGAEASKFLKRIKDLIENPYLLLL